MKQIIENAKIVINEEADSIKKLADYIDEQFAQIVELIYNCQGRVVITGIGKSAIIGNKIVATLNSTGTPALFMHAADAIHGDLGMITEHDVVICISKSGSTPEIKVLVPLLKRGNNTLIAMVSDTESYLAKHADYIIFAKVQKEACPNNLAPTNSTTAQLVMGDALAVCLLQRRNFSELDFAKYHPGGALGKKLYMRVSDLFTSDNPPKVGPETSIKETIFEISTKRLGATAVVSDDSILLGIITDGDLRRMLEKHSTFDTLKAKDIMTAHPKTVQKNTLAVKAFDIMEEKCITQLLVVDEDKYIGIVHIHDILREGIV
ncbi:MAG: KpsF/GutQ family sugar-phosphate isomerase [Bacteroidales bacterium]|nr:KpsF/GutQ family sugar-phosphate isomerase [Bacteroidales bacterium]